MKKIVLLAAMFIFALNFGQNSTLMKDILQPYAYPTQYAKLSKGEIAYVKVGEGKKTLLFLHGLSSNLDAWQRNIDVLKNQYNIIALDLPGYGKSRKTDEDYSPSDFAAVTKALMDFLKIKKAILVGHSMGGQAAIKFANIYPDRLEKLILVAPAGLETFTPQEGALLKGFTLPATIAATPEAQIRANYAINFHQMPSEAEDMILDRLNIREASDFVKHTEAISKSIAGMLDEPVFAELKNIKVPTMIIFGNNDKLIPNTFLHPTLTVDELLVSARKEIKNVQCERIDNAGHFVQFEKPKEVNDIIKSFVK